MCIKNEEFCIKNDKFRRCGVLWDVCCAVRGGIHRWVGASGCKGHNEGHTVSKHATGLISNTNSSFLIQNSSSLIQNSSNPTAIFVPESFISLTYCERSKRQGGGCRKRGKKCRDETVSCDPYSSFFNTEFLVLIQMPRFKYKIHHFFSPAAFFHTLCCDTDCIIL